MCIPRFIFQTWHSKDFLPKGMLQSILNLKNSHPNFKYFLFDDNDCKEFIKKHFDKKIVNAYEKLIPGAFKADLWRYCILYKYGGIYMDIKYTPNNNFNLENLCNNEHLVMDIDKKGIYNALMVCKPENTFLLEAINKIAENVKNKYYGESYLHPTGPRMLYNLANDNNNKYIFSITDLNHLNIIQHDKKQDKYIVYNKKRILVSYPNHLVEREKFSKIDHYAKLWEKKAIYKK